ncbi:hypothetical protein WJX73_004011 [Symbiochloris irregularis]|uniref:Uncharacterized protein n=1 Tax=Symbiochloris irregularis TaxID=706552 RepID=A0AAW1P677_9CHLO
MLLALQPAGATHAGPEAAGIKVAICLHHVKYTPASMRVHSETTQAKVPEFGFLTRLRWTKCCSLRLSDRHFWRCTRCGLWECELQGLKDCCKFG